MSALKRHKSETHPPVPVPLPLHGYIWRLGLDLLLCLVTPITGTRIFNDTYGPGFIYRDETIGFWHRLFYFFGILNPESVRQLHWDINCWSDKQFISWKKAYVANCTAVAVAAAIFATVGLSALSLPNINQTHWIVRALLASSMVLGVFSVFFATSMQQTIALLNNPFYFRLWLSKGLVASSNAEKDAYSFLPLDGSAATLRLLQTPHRLLSLSILFYVVGFALYLLFSWKYDLEKSGGDYRNMFVVFMGVTGVAFFDYLITSAFLLLDARKRYTEFGIGSLSFHKSEMQKKIEQSFTELQRVLASDSNDQRLHEEDHKTLGGIMKEIEDLVQERKRRRKLSLTASKSEFAPVGEDRDV